MRKSFWLLACLLLVSGPARAEDTGGKSRLTSLKTWFSHLKQGLSESAVSGHYQKANVTAVAAVRGAAQDSVEPDKPAWKSGRSKKAEKMKLERAEFAKAVDLIMDGKTKEGLSGLDAFEAAHPKSPLLSQVREAREKVKEMETVSAEPAAAPKSE